jgi:hypothetical protein
MISLRLPSLGGHVLRLLVAEKSGSCEAFYGGMDRPKKRAKSALRPWQRSLPEEVRFARSNILNMFGGSGLLGSAL